MITPSSPFEYLVAIVAFIVAIGVLVAVHEFGHFWVARRSGIRVLRFSIGFGRPLWKRTAGKDPVEYVIAAIPLGGYVKLLDEREGNVSVEEAPRAFNRAPVWKRIAVLLAGPAFNLAFAVLLYWVLFTAGVQTLKPYIAEVVPGSLAAQAGLRAEDRIVAVSGHEVSTADAALYRILQDLVDDGTIDMRVLGPEGAEREIKLVAGDNARSLTEPEALFPGLGFEMGAPRIRAIVGGVADGSSSARAGLKPGDEIVRFDGEEVEDFAHLVRLVRPSANREVPIAVRRDGLVREFSIEVTEETVNGESVGRLGVHPQTEHLFTLQKYGPFAALGEAAGKTWDMSVFTLQIAGRLITGDVSLKAVSGPISIAEVTGFAARQGWRTFLNTLALISISLGILNLLPIPVLDGGQVVYQLAELIKGRPVSERALIIGQQIGIAMLLVVMTLVFYNDIARHLS